MMVENFVERVSNKEIGKNRTVVYLFFSIRIILDPTLCLSLRFFTTVAVSPLLGEEREREREK